MTVATEDLRAALEDGIGAARVQGIERRPSIFQTSFPLEEVDAVLSDGRKLELVLKDLSPDGLPEAVRAAKPAFLLDSERELEAYRDLLPDAGLGTAACYAAGSDPGGGRFWLLIERVDGIPLWQVGELETWQAAARWLAALHERFDAGGAPRSRARHLLRYEADLFRLWARRAREHAAGAGLRRRDRERIAHVLDRYEPVIERLASLPATFIHGEYYASNVLVAGERICPIDWELAAEGPGLIDLAALTTGSWGESERGAIAGAYLDALETPPGARDELLETLDCCRLHLAVQWLGWAPGWKPPRAHRHDWLGEAAALVDRLGL
jgi:hypothetical protein